MSYFVFKKKDIRESCEQPKCYTDYSMLGLASSCILPSCLLISPSWEGGEKNQKGKDEKNFWVEIKIV